MNINIDIESLRNDLINYFGSSMAYNKLAIIDLTKVEYASSEELIKIAKKNGFNLYDYEIKNKHTR